jgi:hypothetical protein
MIRKLLFSFFLLLFTSCLVVKVYQSPEPAGPKTENPQVVHRSMIPSGEVLDLGEKGIHDILFFSNDKGPKGVFIASGELDVLEDSLSSKENTWVPKMTTKRIKIVRTDSLKPLVVIDGKISEDLGIMQSLNPDKIESINVLKGEAAEKSYGEKGAQGVIEITLKKQ